MDKKIGLFAFILVLFVSGFLPTRIQAMPAVTEPYTYSTATIGGPRTFDPAWGYDTASSGIMMQVYETLIDFKGGHTDQFIPELADSWTISPDGLTYTFHIRSGVTFSDGSPLTLEDVEYSFERHMVRDRVGGPMWMHYEPLINVSNSRSYPGWPGTIAELGQKIDNAITRDDAAGTVTFHLVTSYAPYMQILAQTWSSIMSKAYMTRYPYTFPKGAVDYFDWPGWNATGYGGWAIYNNYAREKQANYIGGWVSPLDNPPQMLGTGPFKFKEWIKYEGGHRTLERNVNYWGGWPAGATGTARAGQFLNPSRGYVSTVIEYQISSWMYRKQGFLAGTYDYVYVPRANMPEIWRQPGVRCRYPLEPLSVDAIFFNFNIANGMSGISPYVGTEQFDANGDGIPDGIPLNFFGDRNIRKAFTYSLNSTKIIKEEFLGEAFQTASPIIPGLAPYDPAVLRAWHIANRPNIDLNKAISHFKLAWGGVDGNNDGDMEDPEDIPGEAWQKGFRFSIVYNVGSGPRPMYLELLRDTLKTINPKFIVDIVGVPWPQLLDEIWYELTNYRSIIPIWSIGWLADFADAHNFAFPFMHSQGDFVYPQSYSNPQVDSWIEEGMRETDPTKRILIYDKLNAKFVEDQIDIPGIMGLGRRWERDWVQGWYYNPVLPATNLYTIWKEELPWEDLDADGKVQIKDIAATAKAFGSYFIQRNLPPATDPQGPIGYYTVNWDSRCDLDQNKKIEIKDLAQIAKMFGYTAPPWTPPP